MSEIIQVTEENLSKLKEKIEILEIKENGIDVLVTKNGIVMRQDFAKWNEYIVLYDTGVIEVQENTEVINVEVNLTEGVEKTLELTAMTDSAIEKVISTVEKTKKVKAKKTKKAE